MMSGGNNRVTKCLRRSSALRRSMLKLSPNSPAAQLHMSWNTTQSSSAYILAPQLARCITHEASQSQPELNHTMDCWKCGRTHACLMFCDQCGKLQPLQSQSPSLSAAVNYFILLSQPQTVALCPSSLEREFRDLQKLLHPDKYASACSHERDLSLTNSSIVNQAYQVVMA